MVTDTAVSSFEAQFQNFVYYAGPIIQLLFWVVMIVVAVWAVLLFKKWVDFNTKGSLADVAGVESDMAATDEQAKREPIKVEEFVE